MKQFLLWLFLALVLVSCARVGSPIGGGKDTIPPKMVGSNIDTTRINVPRDLKELRIDFDEYIYLSPGIHQAYSVVGIPRTEQGRCRFEGKRNP